MSDRVTRINPETGVIEEQTWSGGWRESLNDDGPAEPVNPESGVKEEQTWTGGWRESLSDDGRAERVNPETHTFVAVE